MKKTSKLVAAAVVFGITAGAAFQGVNYVTKDALKSKTESIGSVDTQTKLSTTNVVSGTVSGTTDVSLVAEQVLPSIVAIDVTGEVTSMTPFGMQSGETTGSGSGIIIAQKEDKMYIATNNHVIADAKKVTIKFADDSTADAVVQGTDSATDLAVVMVDMTKLSEETKQAIKVATIGDSTKTKVGEQAIAIGNALGYGTSVTVGYVSAKDREIGAEDSASVKLIQTDAAINPGNSGGALVNGKGEVIGINSSKFAAEAIEGMGFAIPMAVAEPILTDLMNKEVVDEAKQAYLGITGRDVTSDLSEAYGMPMGIYVAEVSKGSPAEKAGIRQGYIITGLNGEEVKTMTQLQEKLSRCQAGEEGTITVQLNSDGEVVKKKLSVTFGKKE